MKTLNLVFLGPPGAGKGTQAQRISEKLGLKRITPGDILRKEVEKGTRLGKEVAGYMEKGELVPDEMVLEIIGEELERVGQGFILDGFPRTVAQAKGLDRILESKKWLLHAVVFLDVPDDEIVKRLSARRVCPSCGAVYNMISSPPRNNETCDRCGAHLVRRGDDEPETIRKRLEVYTKETAPLIDYYEKKGLLVRIDGARSLDEVTSLIEKALEGLNWNEQERGPTKPFG